MVFLPVYWVELSSIFLVVFHVDGNKSKRCKESFYLEVGTTPLWGRGVISVFLREEKTYERTMKVILLIKRYHTGSRMSVISWERIRTF